jgi:hypothetical protein
MKFTGFLDRGFQATQVSGEIPKEIGNIKNLKHLWLHSNKLTGPIPAEIWNLKNLQTIDFGRNSLTGSIPKEVGNLINIKTLSLYVNRLSGPIPKELGNLTNLEVCYFNDNQFSGSLPKEVGNLKSIQYLTFGANQLSGLIPSEVGNLKTLKAITLHANQFTGVPSSLSQLTTTTKVIFPNPMSQVPYDLFAQNPGSTLTPTNWTNLLNIPVLQKRQSSSPLSTEELLAMCPLNNVQNKDVPAGCVAGIYNKYCLDLKNLGKCQESYDTVVSASIFKPLGGCAAWKFGPKSLTCAEQVAKFRVALDYITLDSTHARSFVSTIFGSQKYAPCVSTSTVRCIWN